MAETEEKAEEAARKWLSGYWDSIIAHYEFNEPHLKNTPGYEFHGQMYDRLNEPGGLEKMAEFYIGLQPFGTPETVYEKIKTFCNMTGSDSYIGVFRYAGMPEDEAAASMKLFAEEVMPALKELAPAIDRFDNLTATAAGGA